MIDLNKTVVPVFLLCVCAFLGTANAQVRERVVKPTSSQPTNQPSTQSVERVQRTISSRPTLTTEIKVVRSADPAWEPKVEKTASTAATSVAAMVASGRAAYGMETSVRLDRGIKNRYGIPYRYGTSGPNRYDCSGFVWSVFQEAGMPFTRVSARSLWSDSEPVSGDDRFKFGTLVFLNGLGHMGIVADENGFYHASSSKGITYSPFKGYWSSRVVGFRRLKAQNSNSPDTPRARFEDGKDGKER